MTVVIPTGARVIDIDLDTAETNIFKNVPYETHEQFYSTDIGMAFLKFTGLAQDYTGCTARLTLINFNDGSKVQRIFDMDTTTTFVYPMLETELVHAGRWIGQLAVIKGGTTISDNPFRFKINGPIMSTALISFDNINTFTSQLTTIYDGLNTFLDVVILDESGRADAEGLRVVAEGLRVTAEELRATAETGRQTTFEANEVIRDGIVNSLVTAQTIAQKVAEKYQLIEAEYASRLLSAEQQLEQNTSNVESAAINAKYPPIPMVGAKGDGVTDDTVALLVISSYAVTNNIPLMIPEGLYIISDTCIHALKTCTIMGAGRWKTILKPNIPSATFPAIHLDFTFGSSDCEGASIKGMTIISNEAYGSYSADGIKFTNVIRGSFKDIDCRRLRNSFDFIGHSFWNHFENCEGGVEGGIGWLWSALASSNNLNTFTNCTFQGALYGLKCLVSAVSQVFNNCEFSGHATNADGKASIYFYDATTVTINGGYSEGSDLFVGNQFEFNSIGTSSGQVVINGLRFRGNDVRDGIGLKLTGTCSLTINNGLWIGFNICVKNESSGNLVLVNKKTGLINAFLDLTTATGYTTEIDGKKYRTYFGAVIGIDMASDSKLILGKRFESADTSANVSLTGATSKIEATGTGSRLKVVTASILSGVGSPEGVVAGNRGDLYLNSSGGAIGTLWVKESGGGTLTGWIAK